MEEADLPQIKMILDIFDCMFSADPNNIKDVFSELLDAESNFKGKHKRDREKRRSN